MRSPSHSDLRQQIASSTSKGTSPRRALYPANSGLKQKVPESGYALGDLAAFATSRLRSSSGRSVKAPLVLAAAAFIIVAAIGAVTSYLGNPPEPNTLGGAVSPSLSSYKSNDDVIARLVNYARSIGIEAPAPAPAPVPAADNLPDVTTMTDRLAARLETAPEDMEGWTLLLRSRVVLGEQEVAAATLRKALQVFKDDPAASNEIKATAIELGLKAE